jgi:hypothetical protein
MQPHEQYLTTGLRGLDQVFKGLLRGDNVVWQVDAIEEFQSIVTPYVEAAKNNGLRLIYFRFARHAPLVTPEQASAIHEFNPEDGFEIFTAQIHGVIEQEGIGAFYVFDCLSRLAVDWYSDQMLGNFFMLTCPYLFDLETVAYFPIFRNYHTNHALIPITNTTQLFIDAYRHKNQIYVRPIKVQHRYSSTMNMLHVWKDDDTFQPVSSSTVISEIMVSDKWSGLSTDSSRGFWEASFITAYEMLKTGSYRPDIPNQGKALYEQLVRMIISRDPDMQRLVSRYLSLQEILDIRKRMIGTGLIGGKTVGMLVARDILKKSNPRFIDLIEQQDSFFIGSDVFYTFLVRNGIWWVRQQQRDPERFLEGAELARRRIITGDFPDYIMRQFDEMLDYYGQSPFIVRSSSLLEDNYGNSFAGKYDSVFCANQGPRERRMQDFLAAVRTVYASSMSERALRYRARRGMLDMDEQMGLLVMRVSGAMYGRNFYPQAAGVGFSVNPYVWDKEIDPNAGVMRLVFGMGTRAVDRSDDDYTRVVALNAPDKRPEANFDEVRDYAQRKVDYLDLDANQLVTAYAADLIKDDGSIPVDMFVTRDNLRMSDGRRRQHMILTFDRLLKDTAFVKDMREILQSLQSAYNYPVDIEFALNFIDDTRYKINILQCRPLQVQGTETIELPELNVSKENLLIEARGAVVGQSRMVQIDHFIYVVPEKYGKLSVQDRHEVARLIGKINRLPQLNGTVMVLGPGRWGTSSPSLGIPVAFADINRVSILCEIVEMHENLVPDVSLGTHFLNELVEMNMLYLALFPDRGTNFLDREFFRNTPSCLGELLPADSKWESTVRIIRTTDHAARGTVSIAADAVEQKVVCFFDDR